MKRRQKDTIAVMLLTYNRYKEFQLTLNSVLKQKLVKLHIFIFDNASERSLKNVIPNNKNITYIRRRQNIGFANNFRKATQYIKNLGFRYVFQLADDDILAYPTVIADLFQLMQTDQEIHIVRGGFAAFVESPENITQVFTYNQKQLSALSHLSRLNQTLPLHTDFYSGQLYKNDLFDPNISPYNDLTTPFIAPLLKILTRKKMLFLADKITIFAKTEHKQLAMDVYNYKDSTSRGIKRSFTLIGRKYHNKTHFTELINYKIYSNKPKLVKKYFQECLQDDSANKVLCLAIFIMPRFFLKYLKVISKKISALLLRRCVSNHSYLDFEVNTYTK